MEHQNFIAFGTYAKTPIQWQILKQSNDTALVLSRYVLDAKRIFPDCIYTSWENCTLRNWLNQHFFKEAFTSDEQEQIQDFYQDKLFLLDEKELYQYFPNPSDRLAEPEPHAVQYSQDLKDFVSLLSFYKEDNSCWWWLRSSGKESDDIEPNQFSVVWNDGSVVSNGHYVNYERGIRPAMCLNLK